MSISRAKGLRSLASIFSGFVLWKWCDERRELIGCVDGCTFETSQGGNNMSDDGRLAQSSLWMWDSNFILLQLIDPEMEELNSSESRQALVDTEKPVTIIKFSLTCECCEATGSATVKERMSFTKRFYGKLQLRVLQLSTVHKEKWEEL